MASFQVTPPDQFDFKKPANFEKWFVRFEQFKTASGPSEKSQEQQVNTLVIVWGKKQMMFQNRLDYQMSSKNFIQRSQENMSTISMFEGTQYLNVQDLI